MFLKKKEPRSMDEILTQKEEHQEEENTEELDNNVEETEAVSENKSESFTDNALKCFGWKEIKTEKWLVKCARVWYGVMSFVWFLFGAMTFAPIAFMCNKVNAIIKNKKNSLILGIAIYGCLVFCIILLFIFRKTPY
jgi:hypothetical protein